MRFAFRRNSKDSIMAKAYQERLIALIKDTVTLLCKNGLEYNQEFCVEGLLGVTLDKDEVFLIPIKELVNDKGVGTTDMNDDPLDTSQTDGDVSAATMSPKRERKKKRRHAESTVVQDESGGNFDGSTGDWENNTKNRTADHENDSYDREDQPTSKRRPREEIKTELSKVKAEDIVVIKEEVDDEEFVSAFQDSSMDSSNLNRTEQGDSSMAYYSQPGTSQGGSMGFSMDQLAEQSALSASVAGLPPGSEGDPSTWLQQSPSNMQNPQGDWQGQKHQVCVISVVFF